MQSIWRIELLGTLQAKSEAETISRFRTRRVGLLLAYLAFFQDRNHSREELAYLLWPEETEDISRRNLRQALSSLRRHLEPPPLPSGSVLIAKQSSVRLNLDIVSTDVGEFETLLAKASKIGSLEGRIEALEDAVGLYKGALLPGHYDDWVQTERQRLEDSYVFALKTLVGLCRETGKVEKAISYIRLALVEEPLDEELHTALIQLYLDSGRPGSALNQFKELQQILELQLHAQPGEEAQSLALRARAEGGETSPKATRARPELLAMSDRGRERESRQVQLPVRLTRFYGRSQELERTLRYFLEDAVKLVSLVGPAGVGKTRLSQEVGRHLAEQFGWNVWFVPLADISDGAMMLDAIADVISVRRDGQRAPLDQIQRSVKGANNLIVLDNLEHILDAAIPVVGTLLQEVPGARFLATSRHSLKLEGDYEIDLQPLPVPQEIGDLADLAQYPSVQLFVNRCQAIHPDYQLTVNNARTISTICEKLEGLPLALEIAAGLSNAFTPTQLLQNLENRLEVLKNRRKDATPRHRSLRAAIDYSYDLLSPDLQRFFASLSVFRGGFTISAADEVCMSWLSPEAETSAGRRRRRETCLRALLDLQERSLVHADESQETSEARFRFLESFREYGRERLTQDEEETLQELHANHFFKLVETLGQPRGTRNPVFSSLLRFDRDNILAALQTFVERGPIDTAIRLLEITQLTGPSGRTRDVEAAFVRQLAADPRLCAVPVGFRVGLLRMLANVGLHGGDYRAAHKACAQALELAQSSGSDRLVAQSYGALAVVAGYEGDNAKSLEYNLKTLAHAESAQDHAMAERAYLGIGTQHWTSGDLTAAEQAFTKAREASAAYRDKDFWLILYNLTRVCLDQGRLDEAMVLAGESLRAAKEAFDEFGISMSLSMMSRYHWLKGNLPAAMASSLEALLKRRVDGFSYWVLNGLQFHALLLADADRPEAATMLLAATKSTLKTARDLDQREFTAAVDKTKAALDDQLFESAWARGLSMNLEEAFEYAVAFR